MLEGGGRVLEKHLVVWWKTPFRHSCTVSRAAVVAGIGLIYRAAAAVVLFSE